MASPIAGESTMTSALCPGRRTSSAERNRPATVHEIRLRTPLQASLTPTLVRASSITLPFWKAAIPAAFRTRTTPSVTRPCRKSASRA